MEIYSTKGNPCSSTINGDNAFALNLALKGDVNKYEIFFDTVDVGSKRKFIASVYQKDTLDLRFEYVVLGTYHKVKNVWVWADQSQTLNKSMITFITDLRTKLTGGDVSENHERLKQFIDYDYYVLPTNELMENIYCIGLQIYDTNKYQIVTFLRNGGDYVDFYICKQIIFERIL